MGKNIKIRSLHSSPLHFCYNCLPKNGYICSSFAVSTIQQNSPCSSAWFHCVLTALCVVWNSFRLVYIQTNHTTQHTYAATYDVHIAELCGLIRTSKVNGLGPDATASRQRAVGVCGFVCLAFECSCLYTCGNCTFQRSIYLNITCSRRTAGALIYRTDRCDTLRNVILNEFDINGHATWI